MSAPIIDSVTPPGPINAPNGTKVTITFAGHDADTKTTKFVGHLEDQAGNKSADATVVFNWTDTLTLVGTTDDGTPFVINGLAVTVG